MTSLPNPFSHSGAIQASPDEAAVPFRPQVPEGTAADLSDIGQIFIGAAKLFDPDPDAYTSADQAYYDLLLQLDDPHAPDLRELPYGMDGIFDPPPLFLREAS